ncbi:hypothetical protein JCGZ_04964 [Jatropha curcas]|uniref:Uncharacterized protein n=1 Tax=Jatropha curcas TaxID=180498 RepID=A0A067KRR7_JATCU|nr:hypothetical protein JCGZ_04964 [Jatropha curcas]
MPDALLLLSFSFFFLLLLLSSPPFTAPLQSFLTPPSPLHYNSGHSIAIWIQVENSFISYDTLNKLGIPQPVQFLQSRYPEGIPLVTAFAHPSFTEMLDAAIEDAIERGS